ncbi:MFS transporter [Cumulibacter manganitolerans]|uniref:MFS transporter n=1 Tax=Cumulibacter manganitolerans TaxID=1884992 RepID=UPI001E4D82A2|nr:MFS transporter [Cumulibacter manganitolerans]
MSTVPGGSVPRTSVPPGLIVAALCFGSLCASLMQSLVIPIQSELPALLGTTASNASWVVTATLLAGGVAMPVTGRLADIFGKKPVLVISAGVLVVGSLLCAVSDNLLPMLGGRVLQGLAMGFIPVAIALVREVTPPRLASTAIAAVSATLGVGGAIGLPLSALIAQNYDWHMLFWLSAVLAAIVAGLTLVVIPHVRDEHPASFDIVGALGLAVGLVAFLVGVSKGSSWGWGEPSTLGAIIGGAAVLALWARYEVRHHDPLVDLRVSARRPVLMTNLAALLIGFGMMAQAIVVPQLLEMPAATGYGLGQSILQAGLWMAPGGIVMMLFAPVSSRLLDRIGGRLTLAIGAVVLAGGYVVAAFLMHAPWQLMLASCVASAGVGIGYAAMPSLIMDNVPASEAASGVGVNSLMRSIGTTVSGAVMGAVLSGSTVVMADGYPPVPTEWAFRLCFILGAAAAIAGACIALLVPRRRAAALAATPRPEPVTPTPVG